MAIEQESGMRANSPAKSDKSRLAALLLCIFLGEIGAHRFYVGKWKSALLQILTVACFGAGLIWVLVDLIMIIAGKFKDKDNLYVLDWQTA